MVWGITVLSSVIGSPWCQPMWRLGLSSHKFGHDVPWSRTVPDENRADLHRAAIRSRLDEDGSCCWSGSFELDSSSNIIRVV